MAPKKSDNGLTLAVIGCGTMGIAILSGIMDSLQSTDTTNAKSSSNLPSRLPSHFIACVRSAQSADRITSELSKYSASLEVYRNDNVRAVREADVILIGCKPWMVSGILSADGMRDALAGKLLLSICAGVPEEQLEQILYPDTPHADVRKNGGCTVVRAMPNTAAKVRESMTVINISEPALPDEQNTLITWMFEQVGRVSYIEPKNMDVCTALCGSGPAFMALVMEAAADGGVAMGLPRQDANMMAAQMMRGATGLVLKGGEHPAILREKTSTPGGCTIGGLLVLEEGAVRGHVAKAVREATVVASQLGQGVKGVNGTRH